MKKFILSFTVLISLALCSQAQVKVGIKAGANLSNQQNNAAADTKLLSKDAFRGYHAGLIGDVKISDHVYLQPQILYSQKGANYTTTVGNVKTKLTMRNIEMPVNILYKATLPFGKLFAGAGPVLSYAFSGKIKENGTTTKLNSDMKNWKRLDISANAIAGIEFNNGFFASVNYQMGFRDMNKSDGIKALNRSVSLSAGYLVDLAAIKR